ncbi:MAG TPA: hypothetical protein VMW27_11240 [Thermoanaerobaculia bacterium]|nr:hypothetical protein [Thermoanaerobaculia bacterium]
MTHQRVSQFLFFVLPLLFATAGPARAAGDVGSISQLDEAPSCEDQTPDVAPLPDGGFVAVWLAGREDRPVGGYQILGRFLDRGGRPHGPAFRVDAGNTLPWNPRIATDVEGNFMVTWTQQATGAISGRVFSRSGTPWTGDFDIEAPAPYTTGARVVAERAGGFTVLWHSATSLKQRRYTSSGAPLGPAETLFSEITFRDLDVAAHGNDGIVAVWTLPGLEIRGAIFDPGKAPFLFRVHEYPAEVSDRFYFSPPLLAIASRLDDTFLVTWWDIAGNRPAVSARGFNGTGQPLGQAQRIDDPGAANFNEPLGLDVTVDQELSFVAGWQGGHPSGQGQITIWTRTLGPDGMPLGPAIESVDSADALHEDPVYLALAGSHQGGALLLWQGSRRLTELITTPIPTCFSQGIYARPVHTACRGEGLCLQDGRFRVQVTWALPGGQTGKGQPVGLTRESGYFWFFGENNVELAVKILDGRTENGHFWVFYGSLSDVGYTIHIEDTETGFGKTYVNPPSTLASRSDITAFPASPPPPTSGSGSVAAEPVLSSLPLTTGPGPCSPPFVPDVRRPGLCLNGQRFEVEVEWHDPFHGTSGIGTGVPLTEDSGYFWFFGEDNLELVVKVLDGRSYNGKFWVFYGALTNIEYTVRVRHVDSGSERVYHNPPFQFRSRSDIDAFVIEE